jgi:dolichol-phosphate mannosyltransferase
MKCAVVIPTYNESDNIIILLKKILGLGIKNMFVIVVDDNSPDGTAEVVRKFARKIGNKIILIKRAGKLGLGTAYVEGWKRAMAMGADVMFGMDGDLSHDPKDMFNMLEKLNEYDVVVGSRHVKGGEIVGFAWDRLALTAAAQMLCKFVLGLPVADSTSAFRGYKKKAIVGIELEKIRSGGYSFLIEMLHRIHRKGLRITEVPITFGTRNAGVSKVSKGEIIKALRTVVRLKLFPYSF